MKIYRPRSPRPSAPRRGPPSPAARTPDEAVSGAGGAGEPDPGGLGAAETADEDPETRSQGTPGGSREKGLVTGPGGPPQ